MDDWVELTILEGYLDITGRYVPSGRKEVFEPMLRVLADRVVTERQLMYGSCAFIMRELNND